MKKASAIGLGLMVFLSIALLPLCSSAQAKSEDATFMKKAAMVNIMEIQTGQIAQQKSSSPRIEGFAQMLVNDHRQSNEDLKGLANGKDLSLPGSLDQEHQTKLNSLRSASAFNETFINMMVKGHKKAIDLYKSAAGNVKDQDLSAYINKTLPVLQKHLDSAQAIQSSIGDNNNM